MDPLITIPTPEDVTNLCIPGQNSMGADSHSVSAVALVPIVSAEGQNLIQLTAQPPSTERQASMLTLDLTTLDQLALTWVLTRGYSVTGWDHRYVSLEIDSNNWPPAKLPEAIKHLIRHHGPSSTRR